MGISRCWKALWVTPFLGRLLSLAVTMSTTSYAIIVTTSLSVCDCRVSGLLGGSPHRIAHRHSRLEGAQAARSTHRRRACCVGHQGCQGWPGLSAPFWSFGEVPPYVAKWCHVVR